VFKAQAASVNLYFINQFMLGRSCVIPDFIRDPGL